MLISFAAQLRLQQRHFKVANGPNVRTDERENARGNGRIRQVARLKQW
jgi:hypothetical protein